jgi:RNA polymerase sigma-70 factor (ECF subfamily)
MMVVRKGQVIPLRRKLADLEPLSDESLVAACGTGDPNALGLLFERFGDDVTRFLRRLAYVDEQDIADLVHDAFLGVFRSAGAYEKRASVRTWILSVAANTARDRARKSIRWRRVREQVRFEVDEPVGGEKAHVTRDLVARALSAVALLPHDLRVAFVLCDVEELPGVEVATTLGIPSGTLYRRLHDARRLLRQALDGGGS